MDVPPSQLARRLGVTALLLIAPARAAASSPSDQARAEVLFDEGRRLLAATRFAEACPKFAESQRLDAAIGTLLNLGDCYEKMGRTASAWAVFRDAAVEAHRIGDERRETVASGRARALALHLANLTIVVPKASVAPGIQVKRDGVVVERDAWGRATPIDPGWHAIEVSAPGKRSWTLPMTIDVGHPANTVSVPPLEDLAPSTAADPTVAGRTQRLAGGMIAGTGAAAIGLGVAFAALAVAKKNDAAAHCHANVCDPLGVELRDDALGNATASTVAVGAGLAAIVGGAALWFTAPSSAKKPLSTGILAAPEVGPGRFGLTLRGAF